MPDHPTTIVEAQRRRDDLEAQILKLLRDFEVTTGVVVDSIDLRRCEEIGAASRIASVSVGVTF